MKLRADALGDTGRDAVTVLGAAALVFVVVLTAFQTFGERVSGTAVPEAVSAPASWPTDARLHAFQDKDLGLTVSVPDAWERVFSADTEQDAEGPDAEALFRDGPTGAELHLEAWDAADRASFGLWLGVMAGHMVPVGDRLPNANLAGTPAHLMWQPDAAGSATYAAFMERDGRYYRITFRSGASGSPEAFRAALASLTWPGLVADSTVPALPPP